MTKGRVLSVQDCGGDGAILQPKKTAKKIVSNNNLEQLAKQHISLDGQIKALTERKEAVRDEIKDKSKSLAIADDKGNLFAHIGKFTIKHEIRRKIKPKPYDQVDNDWVDMKGLKLKKLFNKEITYTLNEEYVESLIAEGVLTKQEVEEFLLDISETVALKVSEQQEED